MKDKIGYIKPQKVFGNIYFVGIREASTHIIDTGEGLILIDPGMPETLGVVIDNIKQLGFDVKDIKIILMSHGHYDHAGATRELLKHTNAVTYIGKDDLKMVNGEENTSLAELFGVSFKDFFTPDVLLEDGDTVKLGNTSIQCLSTPGHTDGTMSFFFDVTEGEKTYLAGMHGGVGTNTLTFEFLRKNGLPLSNREKFIEGIKRVKAKKVEIFLGNHVGNNDTEGKLKRVSNGENHAFYAPWEWQNFLDARIKRVEEIKMENCKNLFDEIDRLNEEFTSFWIDVGNIESPTLFKEGVDAVGKYFADFSKKQGFSVEIFEQPIAGNVVCITMNPQSEKQPLTLSAHIDTVHNVGSFGNPPVKVDGDYIYGPGVTDCKGGGVAAMMAMTALKNIGFTDRPVRLLLQSDEEINSAPSSQQTINYICEKSKDSIAFLNCESTRGNSAVLWRKGICRYKLEITGKSIHASRCAEGGASAIAEAARKILELEKMKDKDGITCNCGLINGGTAPNTVPDNCNFVAEFRFNNGEEFEIAENKIKEVAKKNYIRGTTCVAERIGLRPAMEKTRRNFDLLDKMNEIYKNCGMPELTARQSLGGSDAANVTVSGIPCVDSIGVAGDKIHTPDEYGILSSLAEAAKRIAAVCFYI